MLKAALLFAVMTATPALAQQVDFALGATTASAPPTAIDQPVKYEARAFPLQAVRLTGGPLFDAQEANKRFLLKLDPDRLLRGLRMNHGLEQKATENYGGWESGNGSGAYGHYLSALSHYAASTGDAEVRRRVEYIVDELDQCQQSKHNGGLIGFRGDVGWFDRLKKGDPIYPPIVNAWYVTHKSMAGTRDAYVLLQTEQAKRVFLRFCDWAVDVSSGTTDEQWQRVLASEHGAPQEILADAYAVTGDEKYLKLARRFTHRKMFDPLLKGDTDSLNRTHANTQLQKVVGYMRVWQVTGDADYLQVARTFWDNVVEQRTWVNGANSQWESFFPVDNWRNELDERCGPETCNTYNMLKLTRQLFEREPDAKQMDFAERAILNSILPSFDYEQGGYVYYTAMRPGHYRTFSAELSGGGFWCCSGTGMENYGRFGELIYAHSEDDDALFVNLFAPSTLDWPAAGVKLTQATAFPADGASTLTFDAAPDRPLTLRVRYPAWCERGAMKVTVNGEGQRVDGKPGEYVNLKRVWKAGDKIELSMPMRLTTETLPGADDYVALLYGPTLLVAPLGTEPLTPEELRPVKGKGTMLARKVMPESDAPVMVANDKQIERDVRPAAGDELLTFTSGELTKPDPVKLVPFWKVGAQRYAVYFKRTDERGYAKLQEQWRAEAAAVAELAARTVDQVQVGAQQSEADHGLQLEQSNTGNAPPPYTSWRDARGFFSYELATGGKPKLAVRCAYWGNDGGRRFDVLVDGEKVGEQELTGKPQGEYFHVEYPVPPKLTQGKARVTVRFQPKPGSTAGGIFDVRLVEAKG